jgi:ankyrin repeat protein
VGIVRLALEKGAEPDLPLKSGLPAWVAQGGAHNPMLGEGATAFFRAAMSGDIEIMKMLLDAGADPLIVTKEQPCRLPADQCERSTYMPPDGATSALQAAAGVGWRLGISRGRESDAIEAVRMLLDLGADINAGNQLGNTALHGAATRHAPALIQFLVGKGADLSAKNAKGWTPLDIATGQPDFRIPANEQVAEVLRSLMQERIPGD